MGLPLILTALWGNQWIIGFYTNNDYLVKLAFWPFIVMLLNYVFALPGYVYINAVTGTGKTRLALSFNWLLSWDLSDLSISAERVFSCIFVGVYDGRISVRYSIGNTIHSVLEEEIQTEYVLLYFQ